MSNPGIRLSLITCTLNSEIFLKDLLRSIESQSKLPYEHIFIDASSSDSTLEIIEEYRLRNRISIKVVTDDGTGISAAMNLGSAVASGTHLLFLHSDDMLHSSLSLEHLEEEMKPNADWYVSNCSYINEGGEVVGFGPRFPQTLKRMFRGNLISHPSVVMKKSFFEASGAFNENFKLAMDYDLWLRILKYSQPQQSSLILSNFRIHPKGASSANPIPLANETLRAKLLNKPPLFLYFLSLLTYFFEIAFSISPRLRSLSHSLILKIRN